MSPARRRAARIIPVFCLLVLSGSAQAKAPYRIGKPPAWVEPVPVPSAEAPPSSDREDLQELLIDQQDRFSPETGSEEYRHYAFRLLTAAGVHDESELTIDVDGSFQQLILHSVTLHRSSNAVDVLGTSQIRVTSRQSDDAARIYDDGLSVHILIPDTRVGDTVEYAYSRRGDNPAVHGHFARTYTIATRVPVVADLRRVLYGGTAPVRTRADRSSLRPERRDVDGFQELVWRQQRVPAVEPDDDLPDWFEPFPSVEVSDFESWASVVAWALPLYEQPNTLTTEGEALVHEWERNQDPEQRLLRAIRFVQDDIRYLGIEIGPSSFTPRPAAKVLADRFGDCKDKSLLLVTLLRRLGVRAYPVLVSATAPKVSMETLPSPFAFDHVIVKATVGDLAFFIDATSTHQRGGIERLRAHGLGLGLVVAPGVDRLEDIPEDTPDAPSMDVVETYRIEGVRADLRVNTVYTRDAAVRQRQRFASSSEGHIQREYENFYAQSFPSVAVAEPLRFVDQEETNTVDTIEHYRLEPFWQDGVRTLNAWAIRDHLDKPSVVKRTMPLAVPHPLYVRQTLKILQEDANEFDLEPISLEGPALRFSRTVTHSGAGLIVVYQLESLADHVNAEQTAEYLSLVDKILDGTTYDLHPGRSSSDNPAVPGRGMARARSARGHRWTVGLVLVSVAIGTVAVAFGRRRRREWRAKATAGLGETPATAIPVMTAAQAALSAAKIRCSCGSKKARSGLQTSTVRFGSQILTVVESLCPSCESRVARYFAVFGTGNEES